jgi:Rieske Fe-S protein
VLRDVVRGKANRLAAMFRPSRVTVKSAVRMISENTSVALNLTGYVTPGEISSVDDLKRGEAGLLRKGTGKLAAYRDKRGKLHVRSATCTHSGCLLAWNSFETCWDCTCHGSHFSVDGEPLNAPATVSLAKTEENAAAKKKPAGSPLHAA